MNKAEIKLRKMMYLVSAYYLGNKINRKQKQLIEQKLKTLWELIKTEPFMKTNWAVQDEMKKGLTSTTYEVVETEYINSTQIPKYDFDRLLNRAKKFMEKIK